MHFQTEKSAKGTNNNSSSSCTSTSTEQKQQQQSQPIERVRYDDKHELRTHLLPIWQKLWDSEPECPAKKPVDLQMKAIRLKLKKGEFKNAWEFCEQMWQMFENIWLQKKSYTQIHKLCTRLSQIFIKEINPLMRQMGYCCGQKFTFTPSVQFCIGNPKKKSHKRCVVARDQPYFLYEKSKSSTGVDATVAERLIYCEKCFNALPENGINLNENSADPANWIPKSMFHKIKNDQIDMEPFENCQICARKWHRICAMHSSKINAEGFICAQCRIEKKMPKPENKFTAKNLPQCELSRFIEKRTDGFLRNNLVHGDPEVEVVIRVICNTDKEVEVKPGMVKKYGPEGYPTRFPYRSKVVFAFEVVKDPGTGCAQEICFFGLFLQEYGTNCGQPNQRRVNIAYLDSVNFFKPAHLRTGIYYEILLGYLQYAKQLGYAMAHIWSCPPSEGDDYIFLCRPSGQKIPSPKQLRDWYEAMLTKGNEEGTVNSYKDIYHQAKEDGLATPMNLPYFHGDLWPWIIDECIVGAQKEEAEGARRRQQQQDHNVNSNVEMSDDDQLAAAEKQQQSKKKKKSSQNNDKKKKGALKKSATANPVVTRLYNNLKKQKDVFFIIRLCSSDQEETMVLEKPQIRDPNPLITCDLVDTRENFLAKSRQEHWEFGQLRRTKWSTLELCHLLHTQTHQVSRNKQPRKKSMIMQQDKRTEASTTPKSRRNYSMEQIKVRHEQQQKNLLMMQEQEKSTDVSTVQTTSCRKKSMEQASHEQQKKPMMQEQQPNKMTDALVAATSSCRIHSVEKTSTTDANGDESIICLDDDDESAGESASLNFTQHFELKCSDFPLKQRFVGCHPNIAKRPRPQGLRTSPTVWQSPRRKSKRK